MTSQDAYFRQLAKLRQVLDETEVLPDYLLLESQEVTEDTREVARQVRDAVLRGDIKAVREASIGLAAAGFDRSAEQDVENVPELDAARSELLERRGRRECDEDSQGELDGSSDPEG